MLKRSLPFMHSHHNGYFDLKETFTMRSLCTLLIIYDAAPEWCMRLLKYKKVGLLSSPLHLQVVACVHLF